MWIARDRDGKLFLYLTKPYKIKNKGFWAGDFPYIILSKEWFPEVKWEDEEPRELILK